MKVILATTNPGKLKEFSELAKDEPWLELELAPSGFNPKETGKTFIDNAKIKALEAAKITGTIAIADDSGIVVEALDGKPGIHSARYCEGSDADRRAKLLQEMKGIPEDRRQASFVCAMVVAEPDGNFPFNSIRVWLGQIATEEKGTNGFGYDPIFNPNNRSCTAAELTPEEKNQVSHRAQAFKQIVNYLKQKHAMLAQ
jgi:XTP/dITP diphosphohydrolase